MGLLPDIENAALYYPMALAIVVLSVMSLFMRSASTGPRLVREGRVTGIIGRKGHGKTLLVTHELLRSIGVKQRCRKCSDETGKSVFHRVNIATNGNLDVPEDKRHLVHHVGGWGDLVRPKPDGVGFDFVLPHATLVVIDEMHLFAPARQGEQLPEPVRWYLSQCRKGCQEVLWVSQNATRVSLGVRVQTDEFGWCRKGMFKRMSVRFYEPEDFGQTGSGPRPGATVQWTFRYRVSRKVARAYNTYELLQPDNSGFEEPAPSRPSRLKSA